MLITLSSLAEKIDPIEAPPEFKLKDLIAQSEDTGNAQKFGEPMKRANKVKKRKLGTPQDAPKFSSSVANGHVNGNLNGHMNGNLNGHVNGSVNGNVNGHLNGGSANGNVNDINDMSRFD